MKKIFLLILNLIVLNLSFSQNNWTSFIAYHARQLNDVYICDFNHIFLVGGNPFNDSICSIYMTKNAGNSWIYIMDNISPWARSITFTSSLVGYIVGDHGKIMKTTDGGDHWTYYNASGNLKSMDLYSVVFVNSNVGYIVGGSELLNKKIELGI